MSFARRRVREREREREREEGLGAGGGGVGFEFGGRGCALGILFLLHYLKMTTERFSEGCLRLLPFYCIILS